MKLIFISVLEMKKMRYSICVLKACCSDQNTLGK